MPRAIRIFRLATAAATLALVGLVMVLGDGSSAAKAVAGGILVFGAVQWIGLGLLGRNYGPPD